MLRQCYVPALVMIATATLAAPLGCAVAAPPAASARSPVTVRVVKYDGLKEAVKQCRGKVLVVDVWSTT